ncbi:HAMP domain-containing sensor histidine kinase [Mucilaginibacter myungsuensis]|uniref:histidine kinase n=1 Tax=Mucilaginibacter myungsuensis TaxID=649104 RepID=A0A929KUZ1_9SPHI|nr:ATP-binding protein [Mucilaginibacter myungsuensis]MBE9661232.1 PAS domain-containing protein [Mucilaginibacter myungsuensis]MDN3597376.1 ATP-binding protein [Mucilaginibacter myungsuensis]
MKVKNKLRLGFGFLFLVVMVFGVVSLYYINRISNNAKFILKDNYETLNYCREMRRILDEHSLPLSTELTQNFDRELQKEEHNITERGERQAVAGLRAAFNDLKSKTSAAELERTERMIRRQLANIETVNMQAIVRKNEQTRKSVDDSAIFLGTAAACTFMLLFTFAVNFPGFIINPLHTLLMGIRAIGDKNYKQRIHFKKNDEFAEVANAFNDMAERLDDWENSNVSQIMSDKQRIETIIEQMRDAIIGVSENQEVLFINSAAKNILNLTGDNMDGRSIADLAKGNDLLRSIIEEGKPGRPFKIVVDGKDSHFQLETREITVPNLTANKGPLRLAKNSAGKVYMLRNITEFKELDEAKTNFIATISHELKTPISSIKMSLKLMQDTRVGSMNAEQQQLLEHIKDDSDRLLKITGELLDLAQVETGNIQLNFVPSDPQLIVNYALQAVKFQAEQKQVTLELVQDANLPNVTVDVEKTAWVLVNFLSNALRYSSEKSKVIINLKKAGEMVEFSVRDHGKGIEEQYQKRLFDRYFQVPTDGQNKSGSGLGLAISKDFIEAQQGSIGLESALGEGSRFYFRLPAA